MNDTREPADLQTFELAISPRHRYSGPQKTSMSHTHHPRPCPIPVVVATLLAAFFCSTEPTRAQSSADAPRRSIRVELPGQEQNAIKSSWPGISCWFMTAPDFEPDGFKRFIDLHSAHSGAGLLTTSIRHNVEVTQPAVHDQIKRAAVYARDHGLGVVMDLDVRLARQAFMSKYPDEMQELVCLREIPLTSSGEVTLSIPSIELSDHYTPGASGVRPYGTLSTRLLAAYSAVEGADGIDPSTIQDISSRCRILQADTNCLRVAIPTLPADAGRKAFILAAFTLFSPDVFAPHLIEFERAILKQYADVPLAGACKDEWGFPGRFAPRLDDLYFTPAMALEYAHRRPGHDLARDLLLMIKPQLGREPERAAAINHYMEMNWQRNAAVENAFYDSIKQVFGPRAMAATHPTWFPHPETREEVFKNGLNWWAARRDLAQTDEVTPFSVRTALAKKSHSPIWMNMFYDGNLATYSGELWRHALGGGRINFHPVYPPGANSPTDYLTTSLLHGNLMTADCRIRLLNFISTAPIDCPVAIIFGHPAALNWAGPGLADTGLKIANALWEQGFYADLIPSSEISSKNLKLATDGSIQYGPQHYAAALLHHPQYERPALATFFRKAAALRQTALYRTGEWTRDFEGRMFDGATALAGMKSLSPEAAAGEIISHLKSLGLQPQTTCTKRDGGFPGSMMPLPSGQCRLLDGTVILASGATDVMGDPIQKTIQIASHPVRFDAVGIAAIRLDKSGKVEALAAGALRTLSAGDLQIELTSPVDLALWHDSHGDWQGVLQGWDGPIPEPLARITAHWTRLRLPAPVDQSPR